MKYRHHDINIPSDHPFANCKLNRKPNAEVLTQIVQNYADGFVLSINGEWGTGKTTFMKMWAAYLKQQHINSIYFNAWENDFISDPMVAILGELKQLTTSKVESTLNTILDIGSKIAIKTIPALAKGVVKHYYGDDLAEVIQNTLNAGSDIFKTEIIEYEDKKKNLETFKVELQTYVNETNPDHPLIFIVDELDRCRPDYAVEVLERIKHFFSIKGIVFVLSIDKEQLCNSIRGYYGSDRINAEEYIRRFIDVEYLLPNPNIESYCTYLYEYFEIKDFFNQKERSQYKFSNDEYSLLKIAVEIITAQNYSLRQIEKLFAHFRLILCSCKCNQNVLPVLTFMLICIRTTSHIYYRKIVNKQLSLDDLAQLINNVFPNHIFDSPSDHERPLSMWGLGQLFYHYSISFTTYTHTIDPIKTDPQTGKPSLTFKINNIDHDMLARTIYDCGKVYIQSSIWKSIIRSIDLLSPIEE